MSARRPFSHRGAAWHHGPLMIPCFVSALIALQCLPLTRWVAPKDTRVWTGYYMLLVRVGTPAAAALQSAVSRLGPGVVSEYSAPVSFTTFDSTATWAYAELPGRLDIRDPRFDPYIRDSGRYFRAVSGGVQWHVAYVPSDRARLALSASLTRYLGSPWRDDWRMVEFDLPEKLVFIAAALGLALGLSAGVAEYRRESFLYCLAAAILWLPWVASGGIAELGLFYGAFLAWFSALRERLPFLRDFPSDPWGGMSLAKTLKAYFLTVAICAAVYLPIAGAPVERVLSLLSVFLTPVVLLLIPIPRGRRRVVFRPVPIVGEVGGPFSGGQAVSVYALAALLALCLVTLLRSPTAPVPHRAAGRGDLDWTTLQSVRPAGAADPARLPDISEYVAHVSYQQSLIFGRGYSFPDAGERVYMREYVENPVSGLIVPRLRTVKVFDESWLEGVLRSAAPSSIERMLRDQGGMVTVSVESLRGTLARDLVLGALVALGLLWRLGPLIRGDVWRFNTARKDQVP